MHVPGPVDPSTVSDVAVEVVVGAEVQCWLALLDAEVPWPVGPSTVTDVAVEVVVDA